MWLAGFFNPQSFLTAIMQSMARKNEWPLDKMCLSVEVTKKNREDVTAPPREGSFVYGLFMEGRRGPPGEQGCARCGGPRRQGGAWEQAREATGSLPSAGAPVTGEAQAWQAGAGPGTSASDR